MGGRHGLLAGRRISGQPRYVGDCQAATKELTPDGGSAEADDRDIETWEFALRETALVSAGTLEPAFTSHQGRGYGYGWFVDEFRGVTRVYNAGLSTPMSA